MLRDDALMIERAAVADSAEIAALYLASRSDALPYLRRVHSDDAVRAWIATILLPRETSWVARREGTILGFMTLDGEELDQLYLLPGHYRQGVGSRLLAKAKALSPLRLSLFTFQRNQRARAFYEAHGFQIVEMSDGSGNEEGEPDILYEWRPAKD
jgi:GNAT superfamily N-acetyltransferase